MQKKIENNFKHYYGVLIHSSEYNSNCLVVKRFISFFFIVTGFFVFVQNKIFLVLEIFSYCSILLNTKTWNLCNRPFRPYMRVADGGYITQNKLIVSASTTDQNICFIEILFSIKNLFQPDSAKKSMSF